MAPAPRREIPSWDAGSPIRVGSQPRRLARTTGCITIKRCRLRDRGLGPRSVSRRANDFLLRQQLRDRGLSEPQVAEASDLRRQVWHYLSTGEGYDVASKALRRAESQLWFAAIQEQQDGLFNRTPVSGILKDSSLRERLWFKVEMNYDPRIALRKLTVPVLFVFGDQDRLVPVQTSIDIIRQTLTESGHRDFTIKTFPRADHGIRLASFDGRGQFAPGYLQTMSNWVHSKVAR
jgi:pimeloyl-ACP methyl ester carboxylesterase